MKFLLLFILLPFFAFAESGVTNNWKIAGNSDTSKNIVNGSFESGANTGWTVGAGTLTATTSEKAQGAQSGLWSITGAGTIDLCATPTNLANSDLVASGWVKSTSTDLQVCSVINSVENGCSPIGTVTGWKKVQATGTYASGNFCFRLKSVASGAITAYVDDVKLEPLENQQVSTVEQEGVIAYGNAGSETITSDTTNINFNTVDTTSLAKLGTWTNNSVYTALVKQTVVLSAVVNLSSSTTSRLTIFKNNINTNLKGGYNTTAYSSIMSINTTLTLQANDSIAVRLSETKTLADSSAHRISITATAVRDNVIQSWQAPADIGEIKYLPQNIAPTGFIPANGSIIGLSSGSHQGAAYLDLYRVLWQVAQTTAGEPYVISSAKGSTADADWAAAKTIKIDESGLFTRAYLSGTSGAVGAKQLDAFQAHTHGIGYQVTGAIGSAVNTAGGASSYNSGDATGRTTSETRPTNVAKYAFIRFASSQPTLLALPSGVETNYTIEAVGNAGQTITTSDDVPFILSSQSNLTWDGTGFTAPADGNYEISGNVYFNSTMSNNVGIYVNNIQKKPISSRVSAQFHSFSGKVFLTTGQRLSIKMQVAGGTLVNDGINHHISITRLNGKIDKTFVGNIQPDWQYDISSYLTSNPATTSVSRATAEVKKLGGGQYKTSLNIAYSVASGSRGSAVATISGITFKNTSGFTQACSGVNSAVGTNETYVSPNTGNITLSHATATTNSYSMSCNVELESKPTWATQTP